MLTFSDFIFVYDEDLHNHLRNKNKLKYLITARNVKSDQQFWMYEKTNAVQNAIKEYKRKVNGDSH